MVLIVICLIIFQFEKASSDENSIVIEISNDEKNQPVDIFISFNEPCYARDEQHNSIKVFYNGREIESQIYNLQHTDEEHITACNIVFLSQGKGEYVIKYGDREASHGYIDHVSVVDRSYSYQLVGYSVSLDYYAIMEDGRCVFSIGQKGNVFGIQMGQKVVKMKKDAKSFTISSWDYISSFAFFYNNGKEIGTDEMLIEKNILVDGNLMVRVKIKSMSSNQKVVTTAYYTYYYNPSQDKRIFVKFAHEVLEDCVVKGEQNGIFAYLMCLKSRSKSIHELNLGEILPYIHVYGRNGIEEYKMETNPQSKKYKWLLSSGDNVILGSTPWFCMDNSMAYGLIMDKNASGLQIKALVKKKIDVPGLSIAGGGVSVGLAGKNNALHPSRYTHFCELYFANSLKNFEDEAAAFFKFYKYRKEKEMKIESHKLDVVIHSFLPFRMKVEVWRNESMVGEAMARFRRASFDLPEGSYIVKIYARNRFIGERFVKLNDDKKIHVFCSFEGKLVVNTNDGIEAILLDENGIVAKNTSSDGYTILKAPLFYKYRLRLSYKGFILYETELYLPHRSIERKFSFHPFYVSILDAFGFPFEENVSISISKDNSYLYGEKRGKIYTFENIPEGDYLLKINYKNFELHRNIHIPCESLKIEIPIVYPVKVKVYDNRGIAIKARVKFERNGKEFETKELPPGKYRINVYSGKKASMEKYISTNEKIDIVINKNSWILYACIFSIAFASIFFIYRKNYIAFVITMLSISITFRWWHAGNANLYIMPPSMIEFYSSYGKIISLPSLLKYSLILTLILFISSIVLSIIKKYKYSIFPLIASISIFIYSIHKLAKYTTGSIYGYGLLNNAMQTWGMGIGFYIAIIYAILIVGLITNEVRRSR